jgi:hypothetical protein
VQPEADTATGPLISALIEPKLMECSPHNRVRIKLCSLYHILDLFRRRSPFNPPGEWLFSLNTCHIEVQGGNDCIGLLAKFCRIARPSDNISERASSPVGCSVERSYFYESNPQLRLLLRHLFVVVPLLPVIPPPSNKSQSSALLHKLRRPHILSLLFRTGANVYLARL